MKKLTDKPTRVKGISRDRIITGRTNNNKVDRQMTEQIKLNDMLIKDIEDTRSLLATMDTQETSTDNSSTVGWIALIGLILIAISLIALCIRIKRKRTVEYKTNMKLTKYEHVEQNLQNDTGNSAGLCWWGGGGETPRFKEITIWVEEGGEDTGGGGNRIVRKITCFSLPSS